MAKTEDSRERRRVYRATNRAKARAQKLAWYAANPERHREIERKAIKKWNAAHPMICAFWHHRGRAKTRGIPFLFTFEEWSALWIESGKWEERGSGPEKYCMARQGDVGPYALGNVRICTNRENNAEQSARIKGKPRKQFTDPHDFPLPGSTASTY
jgi:hypothetical protein